MYPIFYTKTIDIEGTVIGQYSHTKVMKKKSLITFYGRYV